MYKVVRVLRVYYFTKVKYALSNLEKRHLKVSQFNKLNDPFELLGVEMSDKDVRKALEFERSQIAKTKGLICFSENKYDPVQWAHYAENHTGVCLGFEVPDERLRQVKYVSSRLARSTLDGNDKQERLLTTKFKHWEYEKERRLILDLRERSSVEGLIFEPFSSAVKLVEIYIGCRSTLKFDDITNVFGSGDDSVLVKHTRPAFKDFRIVWDRKNKSIRV